MEYGHSVSNIDYNSTCKWVVLTNGYHSALLSGLILCLTTMSSRAVPMHVLIDILHVFCFFCLLLFLFGGWCMCVCVVFCFFCFFCVCVVFFAGGGGVIVYFSCVYFLTFYLNEWDFTYTILWSVFNVLSERVEHAYNQD